MTYTTLSCTLQNDGNTEIGSKQAQFQILQAGTELEISDFQSMAGFYPDNKKPSNFTSYLYTPRSSQDMNGTVTIISNNHTDSISISTSVNSVFPEVVTSDEGKEAIMAEGGTALMSATTVKVISTVVQVGILPVLCLCGMTMNFINMAVFLRQGLSDRINVCLFSLALCDTGYLFFSLVGKFSGILSLVSAQLGLFWKQQSLHLVSVYVGFMNTSNCLTLLISLERCVCVVWPLKAKTFISLRFTKILILIAFVLCFCNSSLTFFFLSDMQGFKSTSSNVTLYRLKNESLLNPHRDILIQVYENFNMIVPAVSLVFVMAATVVIAVRMRTVIAWRQGMLNVSTMTSSSERREASVTRMLVVVCVIYTICNIPAISHSFFRFISEDFAPAGRHRNTFFATSALMHAILSINSTSNFIVYLGMSTRFKDTLMELFKRPSNKRSKLNSTGNVTMTTDSHVKTFRTDIQ